MPIAQSAQISGRAGLERPGSATSAGKRRHDTEIAKRFFLVEGSGPSGGLYLP